MRPNQMEGYKLTTKRTSWEDQELECPEHVIDAEVKKTNVTADDQNALPARLAITFAYMTQVRRREVSLKDMFVAWKSYGHWPWERLVV